jgi:dTMP kinase
MLVKTGKVVIPSETMLEELRLNYCSHEGPGKFIVVEGYDGCGKTTFVRALSRHLRAKGFVVYRTRFPSAALRRTRLLQLLAHQGREDLVDPLALQLRRMADRLQQTRKIIAPRLLEGAVVISDRYIMASQCTMLNRSIPMGGWFKDLCSQLIAPDISLFMYAPPQIALERILRRSNERNLPDECEVDASIRQCMAIAAVNRMLIVDSSKATPRQCIQELEGHLGKVLAATPRRQPTHIPTS